MSNTREDYHPCYGSSDPRPVSPRSGRRIVRWLERMPPIPVYEDEEPKVTTKRYYPKRGAPREKPQVIVCGRGNQGSSPKERHTREARSPS